MWLVLLFYAATGRPLWVEFTTNTDHWELLRVRLVLPGVMLAEHAKPGSKGEPIWSRLGTVARVRPPYVYGSRMAWDASWYAGYPDDDEGPDGFEPYPPGGRPRSPVDDEPDPGDGDGPDDDDRQPARLV